MGLVLIPFAACLAQPGTARAPSGRPDVVCAGQRMDDIVVYADAPALRNLRSGAVAGACWRVSCTAHDAARLVRRFLLLEPGDACAELRRAESERILRAQPFIAEARVFVVANGEGGVDVEVKTSDETSDRARRHREREEPVRDVGCCSAMRISPARASTHPDGGGTGAASGTASACGCSITSSPGSQ